MTSSGLVCFSAAGDSTKEISPVSGATPEPSEASQDMFQVSSFPLYWWICTGYSPVLSVTELYTRFSQESEENKGVIRAGPGGEPGVSELVVVATPGPLDQKHVLER